MKTLIRRSRGSTYLAVAALLILVLAPIAGANKKDGNNNDSAESADGVPDPATFTPNKDIVFHIGRANGKPNIDGKLDDPMWTTAVKLDNFSEITPGENVKPVVDTEAYFAYDDDNLYVGFVCHDDPLDIRATITDRDAMFRDDYVGIMIDTFKDQQNAYEFFVNPHGIQGDLRRTGDHEDSSYDAVWYSGGEINGKGWTAEISIPFRSVRFPDAESQSWGLHIIRTRPRDSREQHSWVPIARDETCLFCSAGTINGLNDINQGKNLEFLPYIIGSQASYLEDDEKRHSAQIHEPAKSDAGIGVKYGITPNYTLDFSYNPDFSQIESDAAQIDVNTTFALYFDERRPFFLEGADIFDTAINTVYTRMINDPIMAGKITGKSGRTTVGYMAARDETTPYIVPFEESSEEVENGGRSYSNIVRVKRDILEDSFFGLIATDRRNETNGGHNTNVGFDGRIRFLENYIVRGHAQGSYTQEPNDTTLSEEFDDIRFGDNKYDSFFNGEEFAGQALEAGFSRDAEHWNFSTWYEDYSPTFRAENGFVTSNNFRTAGLWTGYHIYTDEGRFTERLQPQFNWGRRYNHDGVFKDEWIQPSIWIRFRKQTGFWAGYLVSRERLAGVLVNDIWRVAPEVWTDFSAYLSCGVWGRFGHSLVRDSDDPRLGRETRFGAWTDLTPMSQLKINLNVRVYFLDELNGRVDPGTGSQRIHRVNIARARVTYQFTKNLFIRLIGQYVDKREWFEDYNDRFDVDPLLSYKLNPFTVLFVGSSVGHVQYDPSLPGDVQMYKRTNRTYFIKFQYLFRV